MLTIRVGAEPPHTVLHRAASFACESAQLIGVPLIGSNGRSARASAVLSVRSMRVRLQDDHFQISLVTVIIIYVSLNARGNSRRATSGATGTGTPHASGLR